MRPRYPGRVLACPTLAAQNRSEMEAGANRSEKVARAEADAREWARDLGAHWVGTFDQMHAEIREWAGQVGVDQRSYEFRAAWCVATTFLHQLARRLQEDDEQDEAEQIAQLANVLATVGLWTV
jgi:hypothetical protein